MTYEEYLNLFNDLKKYQLKEDLLTKLKTMPINENLKDQLIPKYQELITYKFTESITKIKNNLSFIFSDVNYLDLTLVNFKKEIRYLEAMLNIKLLDEETKNNLYKEIKTKTADIYAILIKEANREDPEGLLALTIKNNEIKWSDNYEL